VVDLQGPNRRADVVKLPGQLTPAEIAQVRLAWERATIMARSRPPPEKPKEDPDAQANHEVRMVTLAVVLLIIGCAVGLVAVPWLLRAPG
jgi:hypothetical protein